MSKYDNYDQFPDVWLSKTPAHWQAHKMKRLFAERSEKGYPNEPLLVASQNMGVVPKNVYGNRTVEAQKDLHMPLSRGFCACIMVYSVFNVQRKASWRMSLHLSPILGHFCKVFLKNLRNIF